MATSELEVSIKTVYQKVKAGIQNLEKILK